MNRRSCPRIWEVEAIEDGRLTGAERFSFERHVSGCDACNSELQALRELKATMSHAPILESTDLERMRARGALLRRANEQMVEPAPIRPFGRYAIATSFVALAACITVLLWAPWKRHNTASLQVASVASVERPHFDITASPETKWQDRSEGNLARLALQRGQASVHVEHLTAGQRFLMALPDGEIEVLGTRFVVETNDTSTVRVEVSEGVVALRLAGKAEQLLHAGSSWTVAQVEAHNDASSTIPNREPATSIAAPTSQPQDASPRVNGTTTTEPSTMESSLVAARHEPVRKGGSPAQLPPAENAVPASVPAAGAAAANSAAHAFSDAVAAFYAGNYAEADRLFVQFASSFPKDPRGEDAAFLGAVSRARSGDTTGASQLADEYLRRYPRGLRRSDAERLRMPR